jgi:hypothetical protein
VFSLFFIAHAAESIFDSFHDLEYMYRLMIFQSDITFSADHLSVTLNSV